MKKLLTTLVCIQFLLLFSCTSTRDLSDLSLEDNTYSFSGKPYSGQAIKYNEDGEKIAEYTVQEGTKKGPFKEWHPNGQLHRSGSFYHLSPGERDVLYDGILSIYNNEGEQIIQENYKMGFLMPEFEIFQSSNTGKIWMDRNSASSVTLNLASDKKALGLYYFKTDDQYEMEMDRAEGNSKKLIWKRSNEITGSELPALITPCPPGYRLPYPGELEKEMAMDEIDKREAALSSGLKLPAAGKWNLSKNQVEEEGKSGSYWVKSEEEDYQVFYFDEQKYLYTPPKTTYAYSVRCLFDPSETAEKEDMKRPIIRYGPSENLVLHRERENGTIVVRLCLDKNGIVVFREINREKTTIEKESLQNLALSIMDEFVFAADPESTKIECGNYTFNLKVH